VSRVLVGPFSISIRLVGLDGLRVTYACGPFSIRLVGPDDTVLYLHSTCGTRRFACHVYLWDHLTFGTQQLTCHIYLWDLSSSPSDLWDPTACVSRVPMGPSDLWDPTASGTFLHLHPTCGTLRLVCHLLPPWFNKFKLKKTMRPRSRTRDPK